MSLPHCQQEASMIAAQCVAKLQDEPEVYLAVSKDFYDPDVEAKYPSIYASYRTRYEDWIGEIEQVLGSFALSIDYRDDRYPDWAVGEHVTIWERDGEILWLRLHHEDQELPILIAVAKLDPDDE